MQAALIGHNCHRRGPQGASRHEDRRTLGGLVSLLGDEARGALLRFRS